MSLVFPSAHPLVHAKLALLRDAATRPAEFRGLIRSLAQALAIEATADLPTRPITVQTPLAATPGLTFADKIGIVPILRAGLGMADGILDLIPDSEVRHIGLFRDEHTLKPCEYYNKLAPPAKMTLALVLDPMLATGGSAVQACRVVRDAGVGRIKMLSIIAAPEGIERMTAEFPDIPIHVGVIDERLNDVGFIVPGLGDAGDRQFGT